MSEPESGTVRAAMLLLYDEAFTTHAGQFLDQGTTLFETLDALDAAAASRSAGPDSGSIAAHAEHVGFYLDVAEDYAHDRLTGRVDWKAIWRTTREVTPERWDAIRAALRARHARVRERFVDPAGWPAAHWPGVPMAILAHTAFHLGAIRQILHVRGGGA